MNYSPAALIVALIFSWSAPPVRATDAKAPSGEQAPLKREIIPGSELMTAQERERYRQRIRGAKTPQDEQKVRADHLKEVQERARLRGLRLADPGERK